MKYKTVPIQKTDVKNLSGDELEVLRDFGKAEAFVVLQKLATESKTRRAFQALESRDVDVIASLEGMNIGVDFVLDAVERAKEELKDRGDKDIDIE
jgi:hypothetical protein